jgi:hypothetical protein
MAVETILQNPVFTRYIFPFLLIFLIVYAVIEKAKIFGEGKHQINALIAAVIGLIFVTVFSYTNVTDKLVLFLSIALVVVFVALLLWGFITGDAKIPDTSTMKWIVGIGIVIAVAAATIWATGISDNLINFFFEQEGISTFWNNFLFVAVIVISLALIIHSARKKS